MRRLAKWIQSKRNCGYLLLTLILALLLVSVCSVEPYIDRENGIVLTPQALCKLPQAGFLHCPTDEGLRFVSTEQGSHFVIPVTQTGMVKISILPAPDTVYEPLHFKMSFCPVGGEYTKDTVAPILAPQSGEIFFLVEDVSEVRLEVNGDFTPTQILFAEVHQTRQLQPIPMIALTVILLLLLLCDRWIGYVSFVRNGICKSLARIAVEREQGRGGVAVLHILMHTATLLYAVTLTVLLILSVFTAWSAILMAVLTALAVLFQLLYRCTSGNETSPAVLFLTVCLLIGFLFAYALPSVMILSYDDETHYLRSEVLSRFFFGHERTYADYCQEIRIYHLHHALVSPEGANLSLLVLDSYPLPEAGYSVNFYAYSAYFHLALIIGLSDLLSMDFLLQMALMKLSNVLIYAGVIYLGMRKLKKGGYLLASICLLPTCLFLAATFNYDFWITAFLSYAFCIFLSEMQDSEHSLSEANLCRMLFAMLLGCGPKAVYFVLLFPFLFFSRSKFTSNKQKKWVRGAILATMTVILLSFILPFFVNMDSVTDVRGGEDVSSSGQMKFIFSNPLRYAGILLKFISEYVSLHFAFTMSTSYAYLGTVAPVFATVSLLLIAFCCFTDKGECDGFENVGSFKIATLFACFAQIAVFSTALYIGFTPVGTETVYGVQWRYIVPVLFPALYCIGSSRVRHGIRERSMSGGVFLLLSCVLLGSFVQAYLSRL